MRHLSKLLEIEDSNLAWVLRLSLYGLRTQLQEALKTTKDDDLGNIACTELLKELDVLLQHKSSQTTSSLDVFEPSRELKLQHIGQALIAQREVLNYIGEYEFYSTNDADLWDEMQRLLLRLPEKLAFVWRQNILKLANQVNVHEDAVLVKTLAFSRNELIYPGLTGNVTVTGLCLSDEVDFDSRLLVETVDEEIRFLAGVVSLCLQFIEVDPYLHHALKSVDRFSVRSLKSELEKSKYIAALVDRFQRVQATAADFDLAIALRARLDLDEAIHSLVYMPPGDRYSWWGKLQQEARRTLDGVVHSCRQAGYDIQIRPLWGIYADVYNWSKDDLRLEVGGVRSEVSTCLRVYAKINDEVLPGRLLFRGS